MAEISIIFLGTGSAFSKKYGNNSALVEVDNGASVKRILIDCGRTTPDDLYKAGYSWSDIDAIFITHLHGDHVYGLEEAGFYGRWVLQRKPHIILPDRKTKEDLWSKVLKGTMLQGDLSRNMTFDDYFTYEIVDGTSQYFLFNDVMFSVYRTQHVPNKKSYGIIIGEDKYVIYSSDSLFDKDFIQLALDNGALAVFHDCQFVNYEGKVHASIDELATLTESEREKTYIMHYGDDIESNYYKVKDLKLNIALKHTPYTYSV